MEPSSKVAESKPAKPHRKPKTASGPKDKLSDEVEAKPVEISQRGKKGEGSKDDAAKFPSETTIKAVEKEKRPRKPKVVEDKVAEEKPKSSKKSKKATKELAADEKLKNDAAQKTAKAETKTNAKKSNDGNIAAEKESSTVAPDIATDEGPFETPLESEKGQAPGATERQSAIVPPATKYAKATKKSAKESRASKIELAKASAAELAVNGADLAKRGAKARTEKVKKAEKTEAPATERANDVADTVKKGAKAGTEKTKQAAKFTGSSAETPAGVADAVNKDVKTGAEKTKEGARSKNSKAPQNDVSVKHTGSTEEQSGLEASKSKKRKTLASADTEMVKTRILDPMSEHSSAKKKQKKMNVKSKSIGDAVGELLATASEGANAARASLGGLATSIMGGPSEAAEGATDAKKSAKGSVKKAKIKSKAIAEDVAESSGKIAALDGPGNADQEDGSDDEPDDQTTALLAGLESDGDEGTVLGTDYQQGQKIPGLPDAEKTAKKLEGVKTGAKEGPGVVYVGRIPHGFYEHEMRKYFSQFGDISRLRLSRTRKSGASRHYAFVEFTSAGVAKIVADTMNNYLMFGHILKCKVVANEQIHEELWKGANRRFKVVPWNEMEGRKFEMGLGREQWAERIEAEKNRRASKNEQTKEIGYEFDTRELKDVDEVPVKDTAKKIENGDMVEEEQSLVTAGGEDGNGLVVVSEEIKTRRVKKVKGKAEAITTATATKTKRALDAGEEAVGPAVKKAKKGKNMAA